MSPEAEKLASAALELPREQRAFLAEKLLESLDYDDAFKLSPEWKKEIARRCADLDSGTVGLIPGESVFEDIAKDLG